eukprot:2067313-Ditylum_brightwellii.AAC.1
MVEECPKATSDWVPRVISTSPVATLVTARATGALAPCLATSASPGSCCLGASGMLCAVAAHLQLPPPPLLWRFRCRR